MKAVLLFLFHIIVLTLLTGCRNVLYISKLGWHQAYISFHSLPIQEVLNDRQVDPGIQEKIRFIQEVKRYGEEHLGLRQTKSYSRFYEVSEPILYVVTASEKDQLKLYGWTYPIVGKVTYKGFFRKGEALKEQKRLDERGYDTYLQPSVAYSTLGWFKDPIFSSILKWDDGTLANLILHEMTHATVYFRGKTDFNEQMATFIGNQGAIDFLKERYGAQAKETLKAVQNQEDDLLFSRWIDQAYERLSNFYSLMISREEKLEGRKEIFRSLQEDFIRIRSQFKTEGYLTFDQTPLNNAVLLAHRQYFYRLETFERLYRHLGQDLQRVLALMKKIRASGEEPSACLNRWMNEQGLTVSSFLR
ncbi:MAG TPA: aminopeptidase [Thermodesulfobacteriota bacterium]|nr:aminopeptidase [Thermodesulfobacteriota bacterium]